MTIQIHQPEIEALINERLQSGRFHDAEDVILQALKSSEPPAMPVEHPSDAKTLIELFEPVRGLLTDEEVDAMFSRDPSPSRHIDLS